MQVLEALFVVHGSDQIVNVGQSRPTEPCLTHNNCNSVYAMSDPCYWHLVAPKTITMSIMVIGTPFPRDVQLQKELPKELKALKEDAIEDILAFFGRSQILSMFDDMTRTATSL